MEDCNQLDYEENKGEKKTKVPCHQSWMCSYEDGREFEENTENVSTSAMWLKMDRSQHSSVQFYEEYRERLERLDYLGKVAFPKIFKQTRSPVELTLQDWRNIPRRTTRKVPVIASRRALSKRQDGGVNKTEPGAASECVPRQTELFSFSGILAGENSRPRTAWMNMKSLSVPTFVSRHRATGE